MKKFIKEKGITLIALVITIIVLLILAGVTISTLAGENGILNRAKESTEKYSSEQAIEEVKIKIMGIETDYMNKNGVLPDLQDVYDVLSTDKEITIKQNNITTEVASSSNIKTDSNIIIDYKGYELKIKYDLSVELIGTVITGDNNVEENSNVLEAVNINTNKEIKSYFSRANDSTQIKYGDKNITNINQLTKGSYKFVFDATLNIVNVFDSTTEETLDIPEITDLSGNNRNATLKNGANVKLDEDNEYYINFDGTDDYGQISKLSSDINWADGFKIEFEAQWNVLNSWSRILDFGNGADSDNILVANYDGFDELIVLIMNNNLNETYNFRKSMIETGIKSSYKVEYIKNQSGKFTINLYKENVKLFTQDTDYTVRNIERTLNYLGKSNWSGNSLFNGRLYNLKIEQADGTEILNYNINEWYNMFNININ